MRVYVCVYIYMYTGRLYKVRLMWLLSSDAILICVQHQFICGCIYVFSNTFLYTIGAHVYVHGYVDVCHVYVHIYIHSLVLLLSICLYMQSK